jgi:hypothetical protein
VQWSIVPQEISEALHDEQEQKGEKWGEQEDEKNGKARDD